MQAKNDVDDALEVSRESCFFLAMAKTGPYSGLAFVRGGIFPSRNVAHRAPQEMCGRWLGWKREGEWN
jgi:hypothetical protein